MLEKLRLSRHCRTVLFVTLISLVPALAVRAAETSKDSVLTGTLSILHGDGRTGSGVDTVTLTGLVDDDGRWIPLRVEMARTTSAVGFTQLVGKRVRVTGSWSEGEAEASGDRSLIAATVEPVDEAEGLSPGTEVPIEAKPFVTILCRFADSPNLTPHPPAWYQGLMGTGGISSRGANMDSYWREQSYNATTLQGSRVVGWYNLPQPQSYYVPGPYPDWGRLTNDCTAAADADVFFPGYYGINMFFNDGIGCCGWGSESQTLTLDGQTKSYGVVWQPPSLQNLVGVAHEMGHAFGDPHSDCGEWEKIGGCRRVDPIYGCIPVHDLAAYKDLYNGWIPANRIYQSSDQNARGFRLERLALPGSTGYLLAKVPIGGSATHFYSLETRRAAGYDAGIAGDAVIIQDVDTTRGDPAHIVDANGGSCSDEGAMWRVGERYVDSGNGLYFEVLSGDATSFQVAIGHCCSGPACSVSDVPCPPSIILEPTTIGSAEASDLP